MGAKDLLAVGDIKERSPTHEGNLTGGGDVGKLFALGAEEEGGPLVVLV